MKCPKCQFDNPEGAKFCNECGHKFEVKCPHCGHPIPPAAKFCDECGHKLTKSEEVSPGTYPSPRSYTPKYLAEKILTSRSALEGERKQVTVLFADLKGSMELIAERDPEEARKLLDPVIERMMEAVHHYEGTVTHIMGDGIMALFGAPLAQEDHAVRACYAALRMQDSVRRYAEQVFASHGVPVEIRVGLNSGEVVVGGIGIDLHIEYTAVGQTTHLAARMEQMALPGTALMTAATLALAEAYVSVKPRGRVPVKGLAEPVEVFELTGAGVARTRLQAATARGLTKFVGRDAEVDQLSRALERAGAGHGQIVAVVGEPGVGKSRLFYEFTHFHRLRDWGVLESGSVSYGKATSYLPVINLLKVYFRINEWDTHRVIREMVAGKLVVLDESLKPLLPALLSLLDVPTQDDEWERLDPPYRRQRTLDACKRLLLRESQVQPLVLVFEDLHWIDTETQAFLDNLVESLPSACILLLVNYRPEYAHRWGTKSYYTQLRVDPLPPDSAEALLEPLLGADPELKDLKRLLIERTQGNPLFMEESVRTLVETGALSGTRGAYRLAAERDAIEVPATVQAILASRIDRLDADHKRLLQAAAVVGKDVPYKLLQAVAGLPESALRQWLEALQAAEFLYETSLFPDLEYTFKHALTHEVAYNAVLSERRKTLHGRIVAALETLYADRLTEQVERLAHHALRAELWDKGFIYNRQAGEKALGRSANREALAAFEQALAALARQPKTPETIRQAIDLRVFLELPLIALTEHRLLLTIMKEAEALVREIDDPSRECLVLAYLCEAHSIAGEWRVGIDYGRRAVQLADRIGRTRLSVLSKIVLGIAYAQQGAYREAVPLLRASADAAKPRLISMSAGDPPAVSPPWQIYATYSYVWANCHGAFCLVELGDLASAAVLAGEALKAAEALGMAVTLSAALELSAIVYSRTGKFEVASGLTARCQRILQTTDVDLGGIAFPQPTVDHSMRNQTEKVTEAIQSLERLRKSAESSNNMRWQPFYSAHLAEAYGHFGRTEEAVTTARHAIDLSRQSELPAQEAWSHYTLGRILARQGQADRKDTREELEESLRLARELGMRPLEAQCLLELGLLPALAPEERSEYLATATRMFDEIGMEFWRETSEQARAHLARAAER